MLQIVKSGLIIRCKKRITNEGDQWCLLSCVFEVHKHEYETEENTYGADDQIGDAEERILATDPRRCAYDEALATAETNHRIIFEGKKISLLNS